MMWLYFFTFGRLFSFAWSFRVWCRKIIGSFRESNLYFYEWGMRKHWILLTYHTAATLLQIQFPVQWPSNTFSVPQITNILIFPDYIIHYHMGQKGDKRINLLLFWNFFIFFNKIWYANLFFQSIFQFSFSFS